MNPIKFNFKEPPAATLVGWIRWEIECGRLPEVCERVDQILADNWVGLSGAIRMYLAEDAVRAARLEALFSAS